MLGAVCARHRDRHSSSSSSSSSKTLLTLQLIHSHPPPHFYNPLSQSLSLGAASIWRFIVPAAAGGGDWRRDYLTPHHHPHPHHHYGDGSWNLASDARPARWLHRLDLSYLLFGLSLLLSPPIPPPTPSPIPPPTHSNSAAYRVTGVQADGRCLFRAIAHGACLRTHNQPPDQNRQRDLADQLRAQVVAELLKRREQVECFIEEDFDAYVNRIQQPYEWGGEPELLMASHVLRKLIVVFMKEDRDNEDLKKIANYGEEYKKDDEPPIHVLFYGYGHYDILETCCT